MAHVNEGPYSYACATHMCIHNWN